MKRLRSSSSSDSSDNESPSTSFCSSNKYDSKTGTPAPEPKKPAEVFRKDSISAMKIPDSHHVSPEDYYSSADTWKQEWEKGVQVSASPDTIPEPSVRIIAEKSKEVLYSHQRKYIQCSSQEATEPGYVNIKESAEAMCRYDSDDMDSYWLQALNCERSHMGELPIDESTMERAMEASERQCHDNMKHAIETVEGSGIEYDEDVICDVCRSPDSEEGNDMVFCDKCNICVHQACYGIVKVPVGNWLCRTCVLGIDPQCLSCPKKGGAMKATRAGTKWAHVSCASWIPEVSIACPERMEPITKVSHIPPSRWSLICSLCKSKTGACIQCSVKNCTTPFHVTCAFEHSSEMKTISDEGDEVKFKSFCSKHSKSGEAGLSPGRSKAPGEGGKVGQRAQRSQESEDEFYTSIQSGESAQESGLSERSVDFIYQYWKLKRKSSFNKPSSPPKEEEENSVSQPQEDSIHTRMRMFMHLRQDLERVRNLCYMVSRREKSKSSQSKAQEQMFNSHVTLSNQEMSTGSHNAITYCSDMNDRSPVDPMQPDMLQKSDKYMKPLIRPFVYKWAITQEFTIKQQSDCGVRYCDSRIAHRPNDHSTDSYFYHGVYTTLTVETVLTEIKEWSDSHPKEVVISSFSHFLGSNQELHIRSLTNIRSIFASKLCPKTEVLTLRNSWSSGYQVIVSYEHNISSSHSDLWPHIPYWWANKCKAEALIEEFEEKKQHGRPGGFFVTGINSTEDSKYICTHPTESSKDSVMATYPASLAWVREQTPGSKVGSLNIIAGDFITERHFAPTVVASNEKSSKWAP